MLLLLHKLCRGLEYSLNSLTHFGTFFMSIFDQFKASLLNKKVLIS